MKQDDYKAFINGANCLKQLNDHNGALKLAHRATQLEPKDSDCWVTLGNVWSAIGRFEDAITAYQRAVSLSPSIPTPHYNLALASKQSGDLMAPSDLSSDS
jgi:Flp pilus assembly protein TadD